PLASLWPAHRFAIPMLKGRGELRDSCDGIVHLYAASLRYAAAFGETVQKAGGPHAVQGGDRERGVLLSLAQPAARGAALVRGGVVLRWLQAQQRDLRRCEHAHRRSPEAGAPAHVNLRVASPVEPGQIRLCQGDDPGEGPDLSA